MASLVINAPSWASKSIGKRSYADVLKTGVGKDYAIYGNLHARIQNGCPVIVLDKSKRQRSEGVLEKLVQTSVAGNGVKRYDVYINSLEQKTYRAESLNKCGVAVV